MVLQPDGKIVVGGYVRTGSTVNFMIGRLNQDGTADRSCGLAGQNVLDFIDGVDYGWALALAPDGKIVVAGEASNGVRTVFGVARFNANCSVDTSFNASGWQLIEHTVGAIHWATSVVVQPDLKIVVAGQVGNDFALMRLNPNGSVDSTFGSGGWTITLMGGRRESALCYACPPMGGTWPLALGRLKATTTLPWSSTRQTASSPRAALEARPADDGQPASATSTGPATMSPRP